LAAAENKTAGQVISDLARKALVGPAAQHEPEYRNGFRLLPRTGKVITAEFIDKLPSPLLAAANRFDLGFQCGNVGWAKAQRA
jgi:hypothetical protein